jgi:hypothetical protein
VDTNIFPQHKTTRVSHKHAPQTAVILRGPHGIAAKKKKIPRKRIR